MGFSSLVKNRTLLCLALAWVGTRVLILFLTPAGEDASLALYHEYAERYCGGKAAYSAFGLEYPPGAMLLFILPRLAGAGFLRYKLLFTSMLLLVDLGLLVQVSAAWRSGRARLETGLFYLLGTLFLGPVLLRRFDLVPAALSVLAVLAVRFWPHAAWIVLGLATSIKLFPALLAPVLLREELSRWHRGPLSWLASRCGLLAAGLAAGSLPVLLLAGPPGPASLSTQIRRGLQIESLPALPFLVARLAGAPAEILYRNGSYEVLAPLVPAVARLSFPVLVLATGLLACRLLFPREEPRAATPPCYRQDPFTPALALVGLILCLSKVLSPQFLIWLLPWVALSGREDSQPFWTAMALFLAAALLTTWTYPYHYDELVHQLTLRSVLLLGLRNLLLVLLTFLAMRKSARSRPC